MFWVGGAVDGATTTGRPGILSRIARCVNRSDCRPVRAVRGFALKAPPMSLAIQKVVNVDEAASRTGLSVSTLNKLRVFGGGPVFIKLGRRVAYDVADLDAWLTSRRRRSTSDDGSAAV